MREFISSILILLVPAAVLAQDAQATGVIYSSGPVYLDGAQLANSMPVISGAIIETKDTGNARIDMAGSSATIQSNAVVRSRDGGIALDRGAVSVGTSKSLKVFARDFEITPVSSDWTQFEVVRSAGVIHISAVKNSVEIKCGMGAPTIVREGHQITRIDAQNCGLAEIKGAPVAAKGPLLASPWVVGTAGAGGSGLLIWTLTRGEDPISPDSPDNN